MRTVDPCDEFPCTLEGVLLSDLGFNQQQYRGIQAQFNPVTGLLQPGGIPGLRFVPGGFSGDANSSTVLFSSQRAVGGGYSVREAFFEFGIPLLKSGKLNLDEAFRVAQYSGSGDADAWKTGVSYQATRKLRIRAAQHGRSMEEEARNILRSALLEKIGKPTSLYEAIRRRIAPLGGVDLDIPRRQPLREPPRFDQ